MEQTDLQRLKQKCIEHNKNLLPSLEKAMDGIIEGMKCLKTECWWNRGRQCEFDVDGCESRIPDNHPESHTFTGLVVRLSSSFWSNDRGCHQKRSLLFMKKMSTGNIKEWNCLKDDAEMAGADLVFERIINMKDCHDGLYEVHMVNTSVDFESGCLEDWEYELKRIGTE